jgi:hypothetical protein
MRWLPPARGCLVWTKSRCISVRSSFYIMFDFDPFPMEDVFVFYSNWDNDALVHFDFSLFLLYHERRGDQTEGTRPEKTEGETNPLIRGAHLSGRTKKLGRNWLCFNITYI